MDLNTRPDPPQAAAPNDARAFADERRSPARLVEKRGDNRKSLGSRGIHRSNLLIAKEWHAVSIPMAAAPLLGFAIYGNMPTLLISILLTASVLLTFAAPWFRKLEEARSPDFAKQAIWLLPAVAAPMLLFGVACIAISRSELIPWPATIAILLMVSMVAMLIKSGRLVSLVASQTAIWTGAVVTLNDPIVYAVWSSGMAAGGYTFWRQMFVLRRREQADIEEARERSRAQMILTEYEATGQGWFWEIDRRFTITYVSPQVAKALDIDVDQLIGRNFTDLFDLSNQEGNDSERTLSFHLNARSGFTELAVRAALEDERWWSISGRPAYDEYNNFMGFRGSGTDLTEKRRSQEKATRLARYDSLTGLSNRFQMSQTLEKLLNAPNMAQRDCAIFLLDLDRFKQVNDTLGHPAGDALLKHVAQRLERVIGQRGRVGRLGGDEFEVILPGAIERPKLAELARRVIDTLSQPYAIDNSRVVIGASVGIALAPDDGVTSEALIRNADLALYAAKDGGRGRFHFFDKNLHSDAEERRELEQDLRDAIANGGLQLHYQPVVAVASERITGFEALLRWTHPVKGPMSPAKFIPIAEDTGLIAPIGEWALRTACADMAKWPDSVRCAVNVSPLQFANPSLPAIVTSALASSGIPADRLELEITESVFLNDDEGTEAMFAALKRVGVRLALDDFGTGYSSLGYLKKAPFDKIKIDQSFVRGATIAGSRNGAIIASIVSLAEALGMETTAEGVETLDELDLVRALGCSHIQGYIYDKPLSAENAQNRLREGLTAIAKGPKSNRAFRRKMFRTVTLHNDGHRYAAKIRNISDTGAMIEGLWNVPKGTVFKVEIADGQLVSATTRWSQDDRMGVEFTQAVNLDQTAGQHGKPFRETLPLPAAEEKLRRAG